MRASRHAVRRLASLAAAVVVAPAAAWSAAASVAPKRVPSYGDATVTSVDGPARLTLKTKVGPVQIRLDMIDTPEPGECGARESAAVLTRLTSGQRRRVRYVLWSRRPDAEGRLPAFVGPRGADLTKRSLAKDLVDREWARNGEVVTISESDGITMRGAADLWGPRVLRGVWAKCGGLMHLPAGETPPPHAPAPWAVNGNGVTESIGPISLPSTLAPGTALSVADVERIARVESTDMGEGTCWARVPSLELVLLVSPAAGKPCRLGEVSAVASTGPGVAATTTGLQAGRPASAALPLFPRLAATLENDISLQDQLPLAGYTRVPWAWQTLAGVDKRSGKIVGFSTSTAPWGG